MPGEHLLLACRAGFEKECASEVSAQAAGRGVEGFVRARPGSAFAVFNAHDPQHGAAFAAAIAPRDLVFARELVRVGPLLAGLPAGDRAAPIAGAAAAFGRRFRSLWIEMPDTNEGKALATLARPLAPHLERALAARGIAIDAPSASLRLHVFLVGSAACHVGVSDAAQGNGWPMGIPRLRMPRGAASRSTLKLAEAILEFLGQDEQARRLRPGMTAVDLGASPGGWTYQLVRRGLHVTAVDNGALDPALLETGQVRHWRTDGFGFRPEQPVDWMVCDMVESPAKVARLAARWIAEGWCRESIFNLKLPMKRRWDEVLRLRDLIEEELRGKPAALRMKQLYHDREEVSAHLRRE